MGRKTETLHFDWNETRNFLWRNEEERDFIKRLYGENESLDINAVEQSIKGFRFRKRLKQLHQLAKPIRKQANKNLVLRAIICLGPFLASLTCFCFDLPFIYTLLTLMMAILLSSTWKRYLYILQTMYCFIALITWWIEFGNYYFRLWHIGSPLNTAFIILRIVIFCWGFWITILGLIVPFREKEETILPRKCYKISFVFSVLMGVLGYFGVIRYLAFFYVNPFTGWLISWTLLLSDPQIGSVIGAVILGWLLLGYCAVLYCIVRAILEPFTASPEQDNFTHLLA